MIASSDDVQLFREIQKELEIFKNTVKGINTEESNRVTAENIRKSQEETRQNSEITRNNVFNQIKSDWDVIKDDDYKLEVHNSRTSIFEGEKNSLDERLNADFSEINQKFYNSQLIEYEGQNITANNSLAGITKDIKIEGATYQNLTPEFYNNYCNKFSWKCERNTSHYTEHNIKNGGNVGLIEKNKTYTCISNSKLIFSQNTNDPNNLNPRRTCYLMFYNVSNSTTEFVRSVAITPSLRVNEQSFKYITVFKTNFNFNKITLRLFTADINDRTEWEGELNNLIILEGNYTNKPIPQYFEGIKSVGEAEENKLNVLSTGKNFFDFLNHKLADIRSTHKVIRNGYEGAFIGEGGNGYFQLENYIKLKSNTRYTLSLDVYGENFVKAQSGRVRIFDNKHNKSITYTEALKSPNNIEHKKAKFISPTNGEIKLGFYVSSNDSIGDESINALFRWTNIQIEESSTSTSYEFYKSDKKGILLTNPLRGLPNGIKDSIEFINNKWCYIQRIGKVILNGSETWTLEQTFEDKLGFYSYLRTSNGTSIIADTLKVTIRSDVTTDNNKDKIIALDDKYKVLRIGMLKTSLSTPDSNGLKTWLRTNPATVYYELETPIITPLDINLNMITWENITHLFSINQIPPYITCKIPTNIQTIIKGLKDKNTYLTEENKLLKYNQSLQDSNLELTNYAIDFILLSNENNLTINQINKLYGSHNMAIYIANRIIYYGNINVEQGKEIYRAFFNKQRYLHFKNEVDKILILKNKKYLISKGVIKCN